MGTVNSQSKKQTVAKSDHNLSDAGYFPNNIKQKLALSNETLNQLINLFTNGEFEACKSMALTLTIQHPKHGFAWKILGTVYQNESENEAARDALINAVKFFPKDADVHYNLANAYFDLGQETLAIKHYRKSIKIKPDFLKAHYNLGSLYFSVENYSLAEKHLKTVTKLDPKNYEAYLQLTKVYDVQERYIDAIALLKSAIELQPDFSAAYLSLAIEYQNAKLKDEAIQTYEKVITLTPNDMNAYNSYGTYLLKLKKYAQAESLLLKALEVDDSSPDILNTLSLVYSGKKNKEEATYYLQKSMVKHPNNVLGYINYGLLLLNSGNVASASAYFIKALALEPDNVIALNNLGLGFIAISDFPNAVEKFEEVLAIDPKYIPALTNISVPLKRLGRMTEAEDYLKQALSIDPKSHDSNVNLASVYQGRGLIKESIEYNLKAIDVNPILTLPYSNMLFSMSYSNDFPQSFVKEQLTKYGDVVTKNAAFEYKKWLPNTTNRLKVGFVSADFILHPVTSFLSTVLANIDQDRFELYAYSNLVKQDDITKQIKPYFQHWHSIVGLEDDEVAKLIYQDGLDILIDLSGHSAGNRLPVFAYKPAPVQATWLGYWASTGVNQIDYIILDEVSAPVEIADQFTEKVHYIPETRFCYSPPNDPIDIGPLPAIKNGFVTIGCYHNYAKVTDEVLSSWAEVLKQSPTTVLRWQTTAFADQNMISTIQSKFSKLKIDTSRIALLPSTSRQEYLSSYNEVDFVLDCFPFTACTTTSDALWMGVPTLTIAGDSLVSRQSTSLMNVIGLPEWIAKDANQYVEKAIAFTHDIAMLETIRNSLRNKLLSSTLGDAKQFTRNIEHAFTTMHESYQAQNSIGHVETQMQHQASKVAVNIVSATRYSETEFWEKSLLGRSVKAILENEPMASLNVAFNNTSPLPTFFNKQIQNADDDAILIFIHDDVIINQSDLSSVVAQGLNSFDVIGVAGNKRKVPKQPAWAFIDEDFNWDDFDNLSGYIYAGDETSQKENFYGPSGANCQFIDGVFIASKKKTLVEKNVLFDPNFGFHFYDMDFCRTAISAGLSIGTWDISLTHASGGTFGSNDWRDKYQKYLEKWEPTNMQQVDSVIQDQAFNVDEIYQEALNHQLEGRDDEAEILYLKILINEPNHCDSNHNLGFIEFNKFSAEYALPRFESAVTHNPQSEQYWVSYIDALMESGAKETGFSAIEHGQRYGLTEESATQLKNEYLNSLDPNNYLDDENPNKASSNENVKILLESCLNKSVAEIKSCTQQNSINVDDKKDVSAFFDLSAFEPSINFLTKLNAHNEKLELIFKASINLIFRPEITGHKLYLPYFDEILENMKIDIGSVIPRANKIGNLVVATELYDSGGHTKVVAELLESLENPILIVTDICNRFNHQNYAEKIAPSFIKCPVLVLPYESYLDKTTRLAAFMNSFAKDVFLVTHHFDVVALAASQKKIDTQFHFIHHADHQVALGNTISHFQHVDLFNDIAHICQDNLDKKVAILPITAEDYGAKIFNYPIKYYATVTAGGFNKFVMGGQLAFLNVIKEAMGVTGGKHYHFGNIPDNLLQEIYGQLKSNEINPERFIYMGNVPSLWRSLREIDGHIYLGSFPNRGGKGEIEAQGTSYPMVIFDDSSAPKFLNVVKCNSCTRNWSDLHGLRHALEMVMVDHERCATESRQYYLSKHTKSAYKEALNEITH